MPSFGLGDTPAGDDVTHLIETLEAVRQDRTAIQDIEKVTTSCIQWGGALQSLMSDVKLIFVRKSKISIGPEDFKKIAQELGKGNAVLTSIKFPGGTNHALFPKGTNHVFTIEARENGMARVLHAWQGKHPLRVEAEMPIDRLVRHLKRLPELEWNQPNHKVELQNILCQLWGADHAEVPDIEACSRKRISFEILVKGKPDRPLTSPGNREKLASLCSDISYWHSAVVSGDSPHSPVSVWRTASQLDVRSSQQVCGRIRVRLGAARWAGLGFVLGAGGVLLDDLYKGEDIDYAGVRVGGLKGALGGGVGGAAGAAVAKSVTPTFARVGVSVVRANAAAGAALFGVLAIWNVVQWKMKYITSVQLRQRLAAGSGAGVGGFAGGAAAGVAGGIWFGPVGAVVGGLVGGLTGGIVGMFSGSALDKAIWDESEDAVMNSYEFFGWHDVYRNSRPLKSAEEIGSAYEKMLDEKPNKVEDEEDWRKICLGYLMVLISAMYPDFKKMVRFADQLRGKKSNGLSAIGTAFYEYFDH